MAHVYKRLKARINRCIENSLELRGLGDASEDAVVNLCIEVMQKAQADIYTMIANAEKSKKPVRRTAASSAPAPLPPANPGKPPVYGPATGVYEAPAPQPKTFATQELARPEDDDFVVLPDNMTDAQFVDFSLRGHTSAYEIEAAKQLAAMSGWPALAIEKQAGAIRTAAAELARDDVSDDDPLIVKPETLAALVPEMDPNNVVF